MANGLLNLLPNMYVCTSRPIFNSFANYSLTSDDSIFFYQVFHNFRRISRQINYAKDVLGNKPLLSRSQTICSTLKESVVR